MVLVQDSGAGLIRQKSVFVKTVWSKDYRLPNTILTNECPDWQRYHTLLQKEGSRDGSLSGNNQEVSLR